MRISDWSSDVCSSDLLDLLQKPRLKWFGADLHGTEVNARAAGGRLRQLPEFGFVERSEIVIVPIAVEHSGKLVDDVGISSSRNSHIPLQTRHLRRVDRKSTRLNSSH